MLGIVLLVVQGHRALRRVLLLAGRGLVVEHRGVTAHSHVMDVQGERNEANKGSERRSNGCEPSRCRHLSANMLGEKPIKAKLRNNQYLLAFRAPALPSSDQRSAGGNGWGRAVWR